MNQEELYALYQRNFPWVVRSEQAAKAVLFHPDNRWLEARENDALVGAAVVNQNSILLLCVDEAWRRRGHGSALLGEAERIIRESGFDHIRVGCGFDYLTPGVPRLDDNEAFFRKRGYVHAWGDTECFDMAMDMADCPCADKPGDVIDGVRCRFAAEADKPAVRTCVADAARDFVPFYADDGVYRDGAERALIAERDGEVLGAALVGLETDAPETGSIGCVATRTSCRRQGVATRIVRVAAAYLRDAGMKRGFLSYTYSGLDRLYGAAGFRVTVRYMMAEKSLRP